LQSPLTDGWGITNNGTHLIVGDSTDTLSFIDPVSMRIAKQVQVSDNGESIKWLNELEWVDGLIYANVYTTDCIAQIDPNTGGVVGWVVLSAVKNRMLTSLEAKGAAVRPDVLNGIAWDGTKSRLFVSGKLWPAVYEIELRPMYRDSKSTDVAAITQYVRETCIVPESRMALLGRR
jgi:glutamine cyclotransferase